MASRFLKLSKMVINTKHIRYMDVKPEKITINIGLQESSGLNIIINYEDQIGDYCLAKKWMNELCEEEYILSKKEPLKFKKELE